MGELTARVGLGVENRREDVIAVQRLLAAKGLSVGRPDGACGNRTLTAITTFQHGFMHRPDSIVEPGGKTWRMLNTAGPAPMTEAGPYIRQVPKPDRTSINVGLEAVNNPWMTRKFGEPRTERDYDQRGKPLTNLLLKRNMLTANVGPFRVTGLRPAVLSLQQIMQEVSELQPEIYRLLGHRGMLVVRYQRGSSTKISNHAWGTAIDLTIGNVLDDRGDGTVQFGLTLLAPIFNRHGWYWGAEFRTEDGMHFEGGLALIESWLGGLA